MNGAAKMTAVVNQGIRNAAVGTCCQPCSKSGKQLTVFSGGPIPAHLDALSLQRYVIEHSLLQS